MIFHFQYTVRIKGNQLKPSDTNMDSTQNNEINALQIVLWNIGVITTTIIFLATKKTSFEFKQ